MYLNILSVQTQYDSIYTIVFFCYEHLCIVESIRCYYCSSNGIIPNYQWSLKKKKTIELIYYSLNHIVDVESYVARYKLMKYTIFYVNFLGIMIKLYLEYENVINYIQSIYLKY